MAAADAAEDGAAALAAAEAAAARVAFAEALEIWRRRAYAGDPAGMAALGFALREGRGLPRQPEEAFFWLRQAAVAGLAEAQRAVSVMYLVGDGVSRNLPAAAAWRERLAEAGDAQAQVDLAKMYLRGDGVAQDLFKARDWFRRAALQGHEEAMRRFGGAQPSELAEETPAARQAPRMTARREFGSETTALGARPIETLMADQPRAASMAAAERGLTEIETASIPLSAPAAEPVVKPVAEPVAEPVAKPVAEPVAKPVAAVPAEPSTPPPPVAVDAVSGGAPGLGPALAPRPSRRAVKGAPAPATRAVAATASASIAPPSSADEARTSAAASALEARFAGLKQRAAEGDVDAQFELGRLYHRGAEIAGDRGAATALWRVAAAADHMPAATALANALRDLTAEERALSDAVFDLLRRDPRFALSLPLRAPAPRAAQGSKAAAASAETFAETWVAVTKAETAQRQAEAGPFSRLLGWLPGVSP